MLLILPSLFVLGILWKKRIRFRILFSSEGFRFRLELCLFSRSVPLGFERFVRYEALFRSILKNKGKKARLSPKEIPLDNFFIRQLSVSFALGLREDAFRTVFLTGFLRSLLEQSCCFFKIPVFSMYGRPVFDRNTFWLDLEGIADVHPAKIIFTAFIAGKRKNRGGRT